MPKSIFFSLFILLLLSDIPFLSAEISAPIRSNEPIKPILKDTNLDKAKVLLGERLFFDTRLSADNSISCASCHLLSQAGADGRQFAQGINNQIGTVNTPTVFNSKYNIAQFWDGRAHNLENQALGPVQNPIEMGANWQDVVNKLSRDESLTQTFYQIYEKPISATNITDAIAEYERSLVTVNAPFDQFLLGDYNAISAQAREGYTLFKSYGCISCHHGANVGGNMFHKLGVLKAYYSEQDEEYLSSDLGRYLITQNPLDRYVFKVPGLRLVTKTAPYFHDGSVKTLKASIKKMARYQLLREIPDHHVELIIAFLETLVGEYERIEP